VASQKSLDHSWPRLLGLLSPQTSCPVEDPTPSTTKLNSRCEGGVPSPSPGGPLSPESVGSLQADPQKISPTHYSRPITAAASRVKRFFSEHLECEDTAISSKDCQQWCLLAASCSASKAAMDAAAACWFRTCSRMPSEALETKLDDGWPESVDEQSLLLLEWRH